ncbi:MAG TPA: cyclopropane-fatty-acyl-phospholipid synthase family protein [Acidothermaceae bacterium]|nr:cyclopropane-fatty-acyl-phospholipid synthase family protein [Acidothermaceae bacterium]
MTITNSAYHSLADVPRVRARASVARMVFERAVGQVPVRVSYPDGRRLGPAAPDIPELRIVRPPAFFARLGRDAKIGFGEAYMAGDWVAAPGTDLGDLLTPFARRLATLVPAPLQRLRAFVERRVPSDQENNRHGARRNIAAHYDLGNEMFAAFLDSTMSYSCALFDEQDATESESVALERAQLRKIDAMLDLARVRPGSRVLEIGCGWGALATRAAARGAHVTAITLSQEQAREARARASAAGELVDVQLRDYRDVAGAFDAIVSVEMLEAVGERYWPVFFAQVDRLLAPGGTIAVQTITMAHERMLATRHHYSWIQKYIFPGGIIPSLRAIDDALAGTALRVVRNRELRPHYARTLRTWRQRFIASWPQTRTQGLTEEFRRMWEFYLAYCEAGFAGGYLGVSQLQMRRESA